MARRTRYEVTVVRADGSADVIQANARRVDAVKRAKFVAADTVGWGKVVRCFVRDTNPNMVEGRFISVVADFNR